MIDRQTKQKIIEAAQILEVVSDFVHLRKSGVSYVGLCPFHSDRKPSFYVSPSKNICKCFSCGEGGSPVDFVMKHEQMNYGEALRYLAKKYHIEIIEREETDEERAVASERQSLFLLNEYAGAFFRQQLLETEEGRRIGLSYLQERGIRPETIERFGLGYSPESRTALTDEAQRRGYSLERLVKVGLSVQSDDGRPPIDRFRGRVIFPVRNLSGQYVAFGGRVMGRADKVAKYVNSPESPIYSKSRELYGLYQAKGAIAKAGKCYLVEGYTDVLSMHQAGITNVVSSSGTALTHQQIRLLRRFSDQITVLYDGDSAGIKAALRGIDLLLEEGLNIKVVLLPDGEDPDSYARSHSVEEFMGYLDEHETDFIHFKIQLYREEMERDPLRRAEIITDILRSIALIPDAIKRQVMIQSSAGDLRMNEQLLISEVAKLRASGIRAGGAQAVGPRMQVVQTDVAPQGGAMPGASAVSGGSVMSPVAAVEPQAVAAEQAPSYEPERYELDLLGYLISHGHEEIYRAEPDAEGQTSYVSWRVARFVYDELQEDGILPSLSRACYDVLHEAVHVCLPQELACGTYFANHDSSDIRRLSANVLASEMYHDQAPEGEDAKETLLRAEVINAPDAERRAAAGQELNAYLAARHARRCEERYVQTLRVLDTLRMALVMKSIAEIQVELTQAQRAGDQAQITELVMELQELNKIKIEFAQSLGERTIIG